MKIKEALKSMKGFATRQTIIEYLKELQLTTGWKSQTSSLLNHYFTNGKHNGRIIYQFKTKNQEERSDYESDVDSTQDMDEIIEEEEPRNEKTEDQLQNTNKENKTETKEEKRDERQEEIMTKEENESEEEEQEEINLKEEIEKTLTEYQKNRKIGYYEGMIAFALDSLDEFQGSLKQIMKFYEDRKEENYINSGAISKRGLTKILNNSLKYFKCIGINDYGQKVYGGPRYQQIKREKNAAEKLKQNENPTKLEEIKELNPELPREESDKNLDISALQNQQN